MKIFLFLILIMANLSACSQSISETHSELTGRQVDINWGHAIYLNHCASCHDAGANGAQIIGDIEGWRSRIARGVPSLVTHAIEGYSGALGYMPPRGGNPTLSHEDVTAATVYIVTLSRDN